MTKRWHASSITILVLLLLSVFQSVGRALLPVQKGSSCEFQSLVRRAKCPSSNVSTSSLNTTLTLNSPVFWTGPSWTGRSARPTAEFAAPYLFRNRSDVHWLTKLESVKVQLPPITDIAFAPDGKSLICCSQQGLQIFSWPSLILQNTIKTSLANPHCVVFSPDGTRLSVGGGDPAEDGTVEIFSWPEAKSQLKLSKHNDSVVAVAWRDNKTLVAASFDRLVTEWNLRKKEPVKIYRGHSRGVTAACIIKTGEMVTAGRDKSVRVWNRKTGELIRSLNQHSKPIHSIAVCPLKEGRPMIATAAEDRTIRFWQPTIGRMMRYIRLESEPLDIVWINQTKIAASCVDGQTRVVDVEEVKVIQTTPAIKSWAYAIARHPSDESLAVAGSGGQLRRVVLQK